MTYHHDSRRAPGPKLVNLSGRVERVLFYNPENDHAVLKVKIGGFREPIAMVGYIASPAEGTDIRAVGFWVVHERFGRQFQIKSYSVDLPVKLVGIEKYLSSGLIKGIGPKTAHCIIKTLGKETLKVIEDDPQRLATIDGVGAHRAKLITQAWAEQKQIREVMIFLQANEVSTAYAIKIYKRYGNKAIEVVKSNPYQLAYDIRGIGFLTADRIAKKMGFSHDSLERVAAGIMFTLQQVMEDGDLFKEREALIVKAGEILEVDNKELLAKGLAWLEDEAKVKIEPVVIGGTKQLAVYLPGQYSAEQGIATLLLTLQAAPSYWLPGKVNLDALQQKLQLKLAPKQIEAVESAVSHKLTIITGGPGTGKTTITRAILALARKYTRKILLAAPTGRAAKRMSEATGFEAKTIHRLLEFDPSKRGFKFNQKMPLDCELLIIDEFSMVDNLLAFHLFKAVPKRAVLVLIGDVNQLPSVGAGNVLKDLIAAKCFKVIELSEIFRQAQNSAIIVNAHRIISGAMPERAPKGIKTNFYFIKEENPSILVKKIITLVKTRIPQAFSLDAFNDVQVLTPMNRGIVGTSNLNMRLQAALNPHGRRIERNGYIFSVGDKVMQIRNNYNKKVYNGDMGVITEIDNIIRVITVNIDGRDVMYDFNELEELMLSYAVSIHKSQGSEYPAVVIPVVMAHYTMLQRNLIYTGVTRGKQLVVLIGSPKALAIAVQNDKVAQRSSYLAERCADIIMSSWRLGHVSGHCWCSSIRGSEVGFNRV